MALPAWHGGIHVWDLMGLNRGDLVNMDSTSGWRPTTRPGGYGALLYDGVNDYLSIADAPALNITGAVTLSMWLKGTNLTNTVICEKGIDGVLMMQPNGANQWFFLTSANSSNVPGITSSILNGNWNLVTAVYDGTNKYLYLNGVLQDTKVGTAAASNTAPITLGSRTGGAAWAGSMDDVRTLNRAYSAAEVKQHYDLSRLWYPGMINRITKSHTAVAAAAATIFRRSLSERTGARGRMSPSGRL
jgi:hypothetical protein